MSSQLRIFQVASNRIAQLGPGSKSFLASLSWVTFYFALSKVFSSVATIIVARYLGAFSFGEAKIVLLLAQMLSLFMVFGMHVVLMRYSAGKKDPAPVIASSFAISAVAIIIVGLVVWVAHGPLEDWLNIDNYKLLWSVGLGALFCFYLVLTSIYQALHYFQQRGLIEVFFAFLMLPGLALGHVLTHGSYETYLIAFALAYGVSLFPMLWKFRSMLSPRHLFASQTGEMLSYGGLSCVANVGYVLTFIVQPIQLQYYQNTEQVGIFLLYCFGSINMAAFATSIISTVFFPKVSASGDRLGIWHRMTRLWVKLCIPLLAAFMVIQTLIILLSGEDFPLVWPYVFLFAVASTLITVQSTYAQIMAAQGVRGMRWGLLLSAVSGGVNVGMSALLIPKYAITGAVLALIINYTITLLGTLILRDSVLKDRTPQPNELASAE